MILKSKLSKNYPMADPKKYLIGSPELLDPVFAGRLAYLAKCKGVKIKLTEGFRSSKRQQELYNMYLQYKRTGKGSIKSAARPGTSWHEFRLAVDTSTYPVRGMNNTQLARYGLCKPIKSEGWHIQPLETKGKSNRKAFAPAEVEEEEEVDTTTITAKMNGKNTKLTSILYKNENYVRLRDLAEAQSDDALEVSWNQATKTVEIKSKQEGKQWTGHQL
ncbi:D-alanyl-D-alanine carboxypeptidase family protein [Anaerovorax sp. IOR16]|uniref:D-alanyl-D-alanine carboxypeptidase family protein n=1 Tax=Anaerovorax sp. IOR16 TaxID=2773458 RepID=UPI0019CFC339|nr:D-alanyl-D-alanine carboxypeptidase family protein [Anaerovorax sp. IOR16]